MSQRVTQHDLEAMIEQINVCLKLKPREEMILASAYGGYKLEQRAGSGVRSISSGYVSTRELYEWLGAYHAGMDAKRSIAHWRGVAKREAAWKREQAA